MQDIYHFCVATEAKTYQFYLVTLENLPSSRYKIIPESPEDLKTIQLILNHAHTKNPTTINTLVTRMKHLPAVSYVNIPNLFSARTS